MSKMPEIDMADIQKVLQSKATQKKIQELYKDVAAKMAAEAEKIPKGGSMRDSLKKSYLNRYVKALEKEIDKLEKAVYNEVEKGMKATAESVVKANIDFMARVGLDLTGAFDKVPTNVVASLISGKVYKGNWTFSKALWQGGEKVKADMYKIVAEGIAAQKSTYDIAKDLEKYVNPTAKKPWDWSKVYPDTNKKVDYHAQRLARTLTQHAYQQAFKLTVKDNPFVTEVIWHSVFSPGRTCALCMDRDGQHFAKGTEPLDHPQGLCYLEPYIPKSMDQIADELASWAEGANNPALDKFVQSAFGSRADQTRAKASAKGATATAYKGNKKSPDKVVVPNT